VAGRAVLCQYCGGGGGVYDEGGYFVSFPNFSFVGVGNVVGLQWWEMCG
jgi:hypothetical protein